MTIKLLLGRSPCTYWSIAKTNGRETTAEGKGWELFKNYLIAKEKFKPDFFLYENNWSASNAIKDQIQEELGCKLVRINSALVSAQKRDRFYVCNWDVEQPEDRGILLKDILETGYGYNPYHEDLTGKEKANYLTTVQTDSMVAELLNTTKDGKGQCVRASCYKDGIRNLVGNNVDKRTCVAIPCRMVGRRINENGKRCDYSESIPLQQQIEANKDRSKTNCLTTVQKDNVIAIPHEKGKGNTVYTVENGQIDINGKKYPIKLKDGEYTIRKLTPVECERLQTMPDGYTACVSNTQRYKGLGNGWTAEVIIHILQGALKDVPKDEKIIVLSMYDGIGTGRYCLDKMGFTNVEYHAFEIDKFAIKVANHNYPDIIQHGDAFQIREWRVNDD